MEEEKKEDVTTKTSLKKFVFAMITIGVVVILMILYFSVYEDEENPQDKTDEDIVYENLQDTQKEEFMVGEGLLVFSDDARGGYMMKGLAGETATIGVAKDSTPYIDLIKWKTESSLKVSIPFEFQTAATIQGGKILFSSDNVEISIYPKKPETISYDDFEYTINENGGVEFDTTYFKKPNSNTLIFPIETADYNFYYQSALTQKEINEGVYRPENVIGSYAVYHKDKTGDYSRVGGENYKTGKAFHIYRPEVYDATGNTVWGELQVDIEAGTLSVIVPQDFLDTAVYPVTVDPVVGFDTAGATYDNDSGGKQLGTWFTMPEDGTAARIATNFNYIISYGGPVQAALYEYVADGNAGAQISLTSCSNTSGFSGKWLFREFSTGVPLVSGNKYFMLVQTPQYANRVRVSYDTVTGKGIKKTASPGYNCSSVVWGDPMSSESSVDYQYSMYLVYYTPTATNTVPYTPSISGTALGEINTDYTYNFEAIDPDIDQIRYGIDWNNDKVIDLNDGDEWLPASGYIPSYTTLSTTTSWGAVGGYVLNVVAEDTLGWQSEWKTLSITIRDGNLPPQNLNVNGDSNGLVGMEYPLSFSAEEFRGVRGFPSGNVLRASGGIRADQGVSSGGHSDGCPDAGSFRAGGG